MGATSTVQRAAARGLTHRDLGFAPLVRRVRSGSHDLMNTSGYRKWISIAVGCLAVAACGASPGAAAAPGPATPAAAPAAQEATNVVQVRAGEVTADGALAPPEAAGAAYTYNPAVAPAGARLAVTAGMTADRTTVRLEVAGLLPNRGYAAHVHQLPCGATGAAAGPHHQHQVDPAAGPDKPSSDPAFANPTNEIWLDLRTDAAGAGTVSTEVPFVFGAQRPASVIVHEAERTATDPGKAGTAGARVACLNVPFAQVTPG